MSDLLKDAVFAAPILGKVAIPKEVMLHLRALCFRCPGEADRIAALLKHPSRLFEMKVTANTMSRSNVGISFKVGAPFAALLDLATHEGEIAFKVKECLRRLEDPACDTLEGCFHLDMTQPDDLEGL